MSFFGTQIDPTVQHKYKLSLNPKTASSFQKGLIAAKIVGLAAVIIGALLAAGVLHFASPGVGYGLIAGGGVIALVSLALSSIRRTYKFEGFFPTDEVQA